MKSKNFIIPFLIGSMVFLLICGVSILNPENIRWISAGDPTQHYLGWEFFRRSNWQLPPGLNPNFGLSISSSIVYSDSIPLLALFFKAIRSFLSYPFQYFGIWYLCCLLSQAYVSWKIVEVFTEKNWIKIIGSLIFTFSPAMLGLFGITAALSSHFLILLALYLIVKKSRIFQAGSWNVLLLISLAVHFYIFAMIFLLWIANLGDSKGISQRQKIGIFLAGISSILLFAWLLGYFSTGLSTLGESASKNYLSEFNKGYGDITTALNPWTLLWDPDWSSIESIFSNKYPHIDNVNYFGMGVVMALIISIAFGRINVLAIKNVLINNLFLAVMLLGILLFSLSNNLYVGYLQVGYSIPESAINIASILRSSMRMIWPIYYLIFIWVILFGIKLKKYPRIFYFICILFLQVIDTQIGWIKVRDKFYNSYYVSMDSVLKSEFWNDIQGRFNKLVLLPEKGFRVKFEDLSTYALRNEAATNSVLLARVNMSKVQIQNERNDQLIKSGKYDKDSIYIVEDDLRLPVLRSLDKSNDLFVRVDNYNVIVPNVGDTDALRERYKKFIVDAPQLPIVKLREKVSFGRGNPGYVYLIGMGKFSENGWGWSYPEEWGTWSEGGSSKLLIPLSEKEAPREIRFKLRGFISGSHKEQNVKIWVNSQHLSNLVISKELPMTYSVIIPKDINSSYLLIELQMPNAISPKRLGLGDDVRELGIGLEYLELH